VATGQFPCPSLYLLTVPGGEGDAGSPGGKGIRDAHPIPRVPPVTRTAFPAKSRSPGLSLPVGTFFTIHLLIGRRHQLFHLVILGDLFETGNADTHPVGVAVLPEKG
jgi:hypothetical protein